MSIIIFWNRILCDTADMRALLVIVISACFLSQSVCRPQHMDYNNENSEEEEDDSEPAADDTLADDEDTHVDDKEPAVQDEQALFNRHSSEGRYLQRDSAEDRPSRTNSDNFPDYRPANRDANSDDQFRNGLKTRQSGKYMEYNDAGEQQEAAQHLTNHDVNKATREQNQHENQNLINKRTIEFNGSLNEEGDMLFQNNKEHVSNLNKNDYQNNEALDASEQSRYLKQYYNAMQAENRGMADAKYHEGAHNLRDRRDTKEPSQEDVLNSQSRMEDIAKAGEDEESAIKRHIKKLSGDELEQLLNSLSEEKRALLKKIINDGDMEDNTFVNKREITKKSEAIQDNNFIETVQSDLSKVQGGASADVNSESSATHNTESTEASKQTVETRTDSNDVSSPKTAEANNVCDNKAELTRSNEEVIRKKSDINTFASNLDIKNQAEIAANVQGTSKTDNKRETNMDDLENMNLSFDDTAFLNSDSNLNDGQDSNDEGYFCSDENLSQFLDDEARYHNEDSKTYKRETDLEKQSNLADSMKSLEESFPNAKAYGASGPYSGPLIRVKRKNPNHIVKKRDAAILPDAKVAYFPYKAENEDEDNDEGNEFDDEGFYDQTCNLENGNKAVAEDNTADNSEKLKQSHKADTEESKSSNDNPKSETVRLGSDTDSILSGVEGVDDNIMYSGGSRNIRTADVNVKNENKLSKFMHPTSLLGDLMKTPSENYINIPHYQENDAFGPLPRSHEGDLGRYKRIRRLKQSHNPDDLTSSDTSV